VLSHVCEEGDTLEVDVASLSTLTHVATYISEGFRSIVNQNFPTDVNEKAKI
jgi:hypothetical protein